MPITPEEIQKQLFSEARRGYDPGEVDAFLERLASEVDAMLQKIYDLKNRLTATEAQLADAQAQLELAAANPAPAAPEPVAQPAPGVSASERQISAALIAAPLRKSLREMFFAIVRILLLKLYAKRKSILPLF